MSSISSNDLSEVTSHGAWQSQPPNQIWLPPHRPSCNTTLLSSPEMRTAGLVWRQPRSRDELQWSEVQIFSFRLTDIIKYHLCKLNWKAPFFPSRKKKKKKERERHPGECLTSFHNAFLNFLNQPVSHFFPRCRPDLECGKSQRGFPEGLRQHQQKVPTSLEGPNKVTVYVGLG